MLLRTLIVVLVITAISALLLLNGGQIPHISRTDESGYETSHPEESRLEELKSLGYLTYTLVAEDETNKTNVTKYIVGLTDDNINLYCPYESDTTYFMDMHGNIIHTLSAPFKGCVLAEQYGEDSLILLMNKKALINIGLNSTQHWIVEDRFHHDIAVTPGGDILSLTERIINYSEIHNDMPIVDNELVILSPGGEIKKKISFAEITSKNKNLLQLAQNRAQNPNSFHTFGGVTGINVFHINTIELIEKNYHVRGDILKKGNVLFCMRELNIIGVLDLDKEEIVWFWRNNVLEGPHQPTLLETGNVLIFDNGINRNYSRIIELNLESEDVVWEYTANPPESFFTRRAGGVEGLPNGNLLITESEKARVFEINRTGDIVWEFRNPEIWDDGSKISRRTIYRMTRIKTGNIG